MIYLIGQIFWFLILTAVLWGAIGWWMRSVSHANQVRVLKADHEARQQALSRARDDLRDQLEQVAATRGDGQLSAAARTRITEHVRNLERENAKGKEQLGALGTRLEALQKTADARESEYNNLRQRLAEVTARLQDAKAAPPPPAPRPAPAPDPELAARVDAQHREIEQLRRRLSAAQTENSAGDTSQREHARLLSVIQAQKRTIEELNKRPRPAGSTGDTGKLPAVQEANALRAALRARDAEITLLREQIAAAAQRPATPAPTPQDLFTTPPEGLLSAPEGPADDLKKISGIGPVLEARLNELGVFHFRQIAAFSEEDIGWIASQMNAFPNRILRDRWVEQAADFLNAP